MAKSEESKQIDDVALTAAQNNIDPTEVERRIEVARAESQRSRNAAEFLAGLTKNDEMVKPIYNPEAYVFREKFRGAANRGELQKSGCRHPINAITQYIDEDPKIARNGNPVNLFECGICHLPIWWVDPWGEPITDN